MGVGVAVGVAVGAGGRSGAVAVGPGRDSMVGAGVLVGGVSAVGCVVTTSPPQAVSAANANVRSKPRSIFLICWDPMQQM